MNWTRGLSAAGRAERRPRPRRARAAAPPATHPASLDPGRPTAAPASVPPASRAAGQQPSAPPQSPQPPQPPRRAPVPLRQHVLDGELQPHRGQVAARAGTPLTPLRLPLASPSLLGCQADPYSAPSPVCEWQKGGSALSVLHRSDPGRAVSLQVDRLLVGLRWRRLEEPLGFIKVLQWVSRSPSRGLFREPGL